MTDFDTDFSSDEPSPMWDDVPTDFNADWPSGSPADLSADLPADLTADWSNDSSIPETQEQPEAALESSYPPSEWNGANAEESAAPATEDPQGTLRALETAYRSEIDTSVAGESYVARSGDSISRIVGTSDPQTVGNFMRANNLGNDHIQIGRNYFVPEDSSAYGNATGLGQGALDQGNLRMAEKLARESDMNLSAN